MTTNADTSRPAVPVSARAEALPALPPEIERAVHDYGVEMFTLGVYSESGGEELRVATERVVAERRARLDAELAAVVQDSERLFWLIRPMYSWEAARKVEAIASAFREAHPNGDLTTDDALRAAIDAARAATPTGGSDGTE